MALIKSSPGQKWPGFSFALHLLRAQGFCFALLQYSPIQAVTARFVSSMQLYHPRRKTAHRALQWIFLLLYPLNRPRYQTDTSGYNTTCATLERITAPGRPPAHTRYHRHARTLYSSAQPPYYNKVYKGAADRKPCQPGGVSSCRL